MEWAVGPCTSISKPINIHGPIEGDVTLFCDVTVDEKVSNRGSVTIANIKILGSVKVKSPIHMKELLSVKSRWNKGNVQKMVQ